MPTVGQGWELANGRPAGFDFLRIFLSVSVILWHSGPLKPVVWFVVPGFFALSGFLVGSPDRNNLTSYYPPSGIFPALLAEVIISALVIVRSSPNSACLNILRSDFFHSFFEYDWIRSLLPARCFS
jgi:peptidoglycan/LPS O-acetylase OafA/YrhL